MKLRITLLALALGAASTAPAAQLPVHYSVDFKEFKRVDAGTALDFEIFSDGACSIPVHFETLVAGDPGLRQEKVLSQKVKNQSPKLPVAVQRAGLRARIRRRRRGR
ncbi:MAG: hypothetical protein P8R42_08300 [Candidatus Binatia bacterium]|nr:hypothetical protein [Candidatus Binatia bacterium]